MRSPTFLHWWVRLSSWWVGSSSLVSEIVITVEWDRHHWWVRCHHWWVRPSSLASEIVITGKWVRLRYSWTEWLLRWVRPLSRVSVIVLFYEYHFSLANVIIFNFRVTLLLQAAAPDRPCLCLCLCLLLLSVSYFRETLRLLLLTGPVSVSLSFYYLSLVSERPCGCCSFVGKRGNGPQAISIGKSNKTDVNNNNKY